MKVYPITEASKILGISRKTLYARLKNEKYKPCFVIVPNLKKGFIFYKKECIEKEIKNKITEKDKIEFTDYYFSILEKISQKNNFNNSINYSKEEKFLKKLLKDVIDNRYTIEKIIQCNPINKEELEYFKSVLKDIESKI